MTTQRKSRLIKRFWAVITILMALAILLPSGAAAGKSYTADRFDVDIVIEPGGTLLVTETVVFQFSGGPYTYAFRQLSRNETDDIQILSAAMDGEKLPQGMQAGQVEISTEGDPVEVRWHFAPTTDQARTFTLKYRVLGSTRIADSADQVKWFVIPSDHEYDILSSTVTIHLPPGQTPADAASLNGANWTANPGDTTLEFTSSNIPADQSALLSMSFARGSLLVQPPAWQQARIERASQTRAAFPWAAGLGLALLIMGGLGLALVWRNNHPEQSTGFEQGVISRPPNELRPAEVGSLFSLPGVPLELAVATLLDLARRGWIRLEQSEKKIGWFSREKFLVVREDSVDDTSLLPHEQTVYDLVFDHRPGKSQVNDAVELTKSIERLQRGLHDFSKNVVDWMTANGWLDADRKQKRQTITILGVIGLVLFMASFLFSVGLIGAEGRNLSFMGTILMGVSIAGIALSLADLIMAGNWHVLTVRGLQAREQWQGFGDYLKSQIRSNESILQEDWLDAYLPDAVAMRFGDKWAKVFQQRGMQPKLAWLRAVDSVQAGDVVGMMAAITATSSGDGGAGGGGGGASGAG